MDIVIRSATVHDVPAMCEISLRAHQHSYTNLIPPSHWAEFSAHYDGSPESKRTLERILLRGVTAPGRSGLVAEHNGTIVGYTLCERTMYGARKRGLFVDPDYQGKGIGGMLFASSLEGLGRKAVELLVVENNARAIRLYEQHGFYSIGRSSTLYFGAHQICMRRLPIVH